MNSIKSLIFINRKLLLIRANVLGKTLVLIRLSALLLVVSLLKVILSHGTRHLLVSESQLVLLNWSLGLNLRIVLRQETWWWNLQRWILRVLALHEHLHILLSFLIGWVWIDSHKICIRLRKSFWQINVCRIFSSLKFWWEVKRYQTYFEINAYDRYTC